MKKIRLNADDLEVLSFTTARQPEVRGTVEGANTGNPCYHTVAYQNTVCLGYPASYWGEETCDCPFVPYTQDLRCQPRLSDGGTCITCPPEPGC
ncbi:MAG TPA: hypothetical protein VLK84_31975 [Longimicrobium sp.]|nr:hypothetical protein [Longimicrobium sp.]